MNQNQVVSYVLFGGLFAWILYRRTRRSIGRQPLRPRRAIVRLVILCLVSALLIFISFYFKNLRILAAFGGGLLSGILLGFLGLKLTRFETTQEGHFYIPDTRIGVTLSLLLAGRLIYRMVVLRDSALASAHPPRWQSPLTYVIAGLTCGYYIVYCIGLLVHAHEKYRQQNALPPKDSV